MSSRPVQRHGFSLLELMIVIGIIALLSTIGFVAFGAIRGSQDQRNTKAAMEIARTMFNAFVASAQQGGNSLTRISGTEDSSYYLKLAPQQWYFNKVAYAANDAPTLIDFRGYQKVGADGITPVEPIKYEYAKTIDYYNVPRREGDTARTTPVPMNAPTDLVSNDAAQWIGTAPAGAYDGARWQLYATSNMIRRLRSSPEAKQIWSTLRESQIKHIDPANSGQDFIIDAWNHPILFVPGSGLRGVRYGVGANTIADAAKVPWVKGNPATTPLDQQAVRSPDGRAFWVSAGPDGFYDTQDDNLYSFNN